LRICIFNSQKKFIAQKAVCRLRPGVREAIIEEVVERLPRLPQLGNANAADRIESRRMEDGPVRPPVLQISGVNSFGTAFGTTPARADRMSISICVMPMLWHQQSNTHSRLTM